MKIWHISDTHGCHHQIQEIPECDVIVHSGDFSNYRDAKSNYIETLDFIEWYSNLKTNATKILIAGNHDSYSAIHKANFLEIISKTEIIYLENQSINIDGINFFGTPYQPAFGNWFYQKDRGKIDVIWRLIPEETDVLIVHGPPKGALDLSEDVNGNIEQCGCKSLKNHIDNRLRNLKLCMFGHIHDSRTFLNYGLLHRDGVTYSNSAMVHDGKFSIGIIHKGNIIEI